MDVCTKRKNTKAVSGKGGKTIKKDVKANSFDVLKFKNEPEKFKKEHKFKKGGGIIYIGRIPHGFYEDQMTAYFNQFGRVLSAVVPRSKNSGRSKGYGFVEFDDEEVAKIAAETMNNYLMYNKILKCRYIPPEERRRSRFMRKANLLTCPRVLNRIKSTNNKRKSLSKLNFNTYQDKIQQKIAEFEQFFKERGINFNFKVDVSGSENVKKSNDSEKDDNKDSNNADDEMEDQFGILEIDTSDTEIHFKTPPNVKKVLKKSDSSIAQNDKSQTELKIKRTKKSNAKEAKEIIKTKRNLGRKNDVEKKMTKKVLKTKKNKPLRKETKKKVPNHKKLTKEVAKARISRKEKSNIKQKPPQNVCRKLALRMSPGEGKKN